MNNQSEIRRKLKLQASRAERLTEECGKQCRKLYSRRHWKQT